MDLTIREQERMTQRFGETAAVFWSPVMDASARVHTHKPRIPPRANAHLRVSQQMACVAFLKRMAGASVRLLSDAPPLPRSCAASSLRTTPAACLCTCEPCGGGFRMRERACVCTLRCSCVRVGAPALEPSREAWVEIGDARARGRAYLGLQTLRKSRHRAVVRPDLTLVTRSSHGRDTLYVRVNRREHVSKVSRRLM